MRTVVLERPRPGFLGVGIAGLAEAQTAELGLIPGEGVVVREVLPETAASAGGIEQGDVLLRVSGRRIGPHNLTSVLEEIGAGVTVDLTVVRDGKRRLLPVHLGERP
jgi:serine protease Do